LIIIELFPFLFILTCLGGQTRAFIHITDTAKCIDLAIKNPPSSNEKPKIFNQVAETLQVGALAKLISDKTGVAVRNLANPRKEDAENELVVRSMCVSWRYRSIE
jgi:UDP-sulfoquinovose synthase